MMLTKIHNDLRNPDCEGFFIESDKNEIVVRRINKWQFDVTTERRGRENTYYRVDSNTVEKMVDDMIRLDEHCVYIPHYPTPKWSNERVDRFINGLAPQMCKPTFMGFTLTAKGADTFTVIRHPDLGKWYMDGKVVYLDVVLRKTRAKLAGNNDWEYNVM